MHSKCEHVHSFNPVIIFRQDIESFSHLSAKRLIELAQSGDNLEVKCNYLLFEFANFFAENA